MEPYKEIFSVCSKSSTPLKRITLAKATKTVPPIIANLPRVCIVVCINFISSLLKFSPSSSTTGTASTVIASATTS